VVLRLLASRETLTLRASEHVVNQDGVCVAVDGGISPVIGNLDRLVGVTVSLRDVVHKAVDKDVTELLT